MLLISLIDLLSKTILLLAAASSKTTDINELDVSRALRDTLAQTEPWESKFGAKMNPEKATFRGINPEKLELQGSQGRTISRLSLETKCFLLEFSATNYQQAKCL